MTSTHSHAITDARGNILEPGSRVQMGSPLHNREGQQAEVLSTSDRYGHHTAKVRFDDGYEDEVLAANLVPAPSRNLRDAGGAPADGLPEQVNRGPRADRPVWVAVVRRGIDYHRPEPDSVTSCGRTTRYGEILCHGDAVDRLDSKPCRRCYPNGDNAPR